MASVLTVRQLNTYVKSIIESDKRLNLVTVSGEISNFKNHYSSGHIYFSLKDTDALIRCVMFKGNASHLSFSPNDGDKVICRGRVSLYEKDGQYQFYIDSMVPDGTGDLALKFELIKQKLEKEGLFSYENKRPLPSYPDTIAVVTSDTGAALQDVINIISRRYPICELLICPVLVQGIYAAPSIIKTLKQLYKMNTADIIIVCRGGGSSEDLSAFNDEELARTVYNSPVPIISAVGHETDITICDLVADLRAPTPSAAAELAVPSAEELNEILASISKRLCNALNNRLNQSELLLSKTMQCVKLLQPETLINEKSLLVDSLSDRLNNSLNRILSAKEKEFIGISSKLDTISPLKVLKRGYAIPSVNNKIIHSVCDIGNNSKLSLQFFDGSAECNVISVAKGENHERKD